MAGGQARKDGAARGKRGPKGLGHIYDPSMADAQADGAGPASKGRRGGPGAGRRQDLLELVKDQSRGRSPGSTASARAAAWDPASEPLVDPSSPWHIDPSKYPIRGSTGEKLRFCLKYAVLAPSSHNSQPWRFCVEGTSVVLLADRSRALPVCDPLDRELTISCGAALEHLVLGMRRHGLEPGVRVLAGRKGVGEALAIVTVTGRCEAAPVEEAMAGAIVHRRTTRHRFKDVQPPAALLRELSGLAEARGAELAFVSGGPSRERLAALVAEADTVQLGQSAFRRELAMWMHHNRSASPDGIPGYAMGMGEVASLLAPLVVRTFDIGRGRAAKDREIVLHSPVLAVLGTEGDGPAQWLAAGRALAAVLLRSTSEKLQSSYLNQPVEVPSTREKLSRLLGWAGGGVGAGGGGGGGTPQLVLRMGYGPGLPHTPRRPVDAVLARELPAELLARLERPGTAGR